MAHGIGARETITYGRNDHFEGGPVGGGRFWTDDAGHPMAMIGGPSEWRPDALREVGVGDTFNVGGQTWKIVEIVDADIPDAYLTTERIH